MKYALLIILFLILPLVLLQSLVLPALESLENTYRNADAIAQKAVD